MGYLGGFKEMVICPSTHASTNDAGMDQVTPPGGGNAIAADGDCQEEGQQEEALEVGIEAVEPGGEAKY